MKREYLEEDLALIRKYFPGARTVNLHTPFDLTPKADPWKLRMDTFQDTSDKPWSEDPAYRQAGWLWTR